MTNKPALWITRKLSDATEARAARDYDVILNPEDRVFSQGEIVAMSARVDAILPCHSEHFDAETTARLDPRVKIIANHSVGTDHCDLDALKTRGIVQEIRALWPAGAFFVAFAASTSTVARRLP